METNSSLSHAMAAFIDILGYESLVKRGTIDVSVIQWLEGILSGCSVTLIEKIRSAKLMPDGYEKYDGYAKDIFKRINVRFISDTILVTLPLSDLSSQDFSQKDLLSNYLDCYFKYISMLATMFIGKTGLVLRGGIGMGSNYENLYPDSGSLFIFSRAYVKAYQLEKKAGLARILIDSELLKFLREIPLEQVSEFVYRDDDGKDCLDIYSFLQQDDNSYSVLQGIKETVSLNLQSSRQNPRALDKLVYFAKYHNCMVTKLGFSELMINTKL
jgi:hypothetical protein